jgi:aspartyl-tRNA(Asn)/glutamyl-tRNA(Gln) amidotransferase subunit B
MTQDLAGLLNEARATLGETKVTPKHVADVVRLVGEGTISTTGGKTVLAEAFASGADAESIVEERGLRQVSDADALGVVLDEVIRENPDPVEQFRAGKDGVLGFLVGQVMKKTGGSANPKLAGELLRERLSTS